MGGRFSKANRPRLPGAYTNYGNLPASAVPAAPGSVEAVIFTHDWGPSEQAIRCSSFADFQSVFGASDDTEGYLAVKEAFLGENVDGRLGAGEVVAYRMSGSAAAKAAITIAKTGGGAAITLTAHFEGTRANDIVTQVTDVSTGIDRLSILDGTVLLESFDYAETNITDLAAQVNGTGVYAGRGSDWVVASAVTSGTTLDQTTDGPLAGGNDGTTLLVGDYSAAFTALDAQDFAVFSAANLTDTTITDVNLKTWIAGLNTAGKGVIAVVGGLAGESLATATTRSSNLADPDIVNVGVGTLTDNVNGPGGNPIDLSTAQLAPRIAGIVAMRGEHQSITAARLKDVDIKSGPTTSEMESAFDAGIVTFARDSSSNPTHIATGLSTWTRTNANSDSSKPYLIYRQPKYIRTMHGIQRDVALFAEEKVLGLRQVNDDSRAAVLAEVKRQLDQRQHLGVIQPGWTAGIDQDPPPSDEDEFIAIAISLKFGRSLEQLYFTISVA